MSTYYRSGRAADPHFQIRAGKQAEAGPPAGAALARGRVLPNVSEKGGQKERKGCPRRPRWEEPSRVDSAWKFLAAMWILITANQGRRARLRHGHVQMRVENLDKKKTLSVPGISISGPCTIFTLIVGEILIE